VTQIAAGAGVSVQLVSIRAGSARWWEPERPAGYRLMLVRQGVFRARVGGHVLLADPAAGYAGGPGVEQSIAHRAEDGAGLGGCRLWAASRQTRRRTATTLPMMVASSPRMGA
jgi:hypothetical protein